MIMNERKNQILEMLLFYFGSIWMPLASNPLIMTSTHPSVVVIWNKVSMAFHVLSKFEFLLTHYPPILRQSSIESTSSIFIFSTVSHLSWQWKNYPFKRPTPITPKMSMNRVQTSSTLVIDGIDARRAFTTNLIPSSLAIILNGLKALNALRAFKDYRDCILTPATKNARSSKEKITTKASRRFQ